MNDIQKTKTKRLLESVQYTSEQRIHELEDKIQDARNSLKSWEIWLQQEYAQRDSATDILENLYGEA